MLYPTFEDIFKRFKSRDSKRYLYPCVHSSIIHNSQNMKTTQVFIDAWMDNQRRYIHAMLYYTALERKEILIHTTTWINLDLIMLSEISQKRTNIVWFHLYEILRVVKSIEKVDGWLLGQGEFLCHGYRV